jgi:hypothetical protein
MIYFENYLKSDAGFNNHVVAYTLAISLAALLERPFYFDFEFPSTVPPDFAFQPELHKKFKILLDSPRSLVSDLIQTPCRRAREINRDKKNKIVIADVIERFVTTEKLRRKFGGTRLEKFFSLGREAVTIEHLQSFDLIEIGEQSMCNASYFYFLERADKRRVLESAQIEYLPEIESLAARIAEQIGAANAIHLRLGDFLKFFEHDGYRLTAEDCRRYLQANVPDKSLPFVVATDGLHEKDFFSQIFADWKYLFLDEIIFGDFAAEFRELPFTDFNVLSIINQLLCARAEIFVGVCRSTFTSVIHRLRQERYGKKDFLFFPESRIRRLLNADFRIAPDSAGFFDWNKYSPFYECLRYPAWMREWDFDLTAIDF